MESASENKLLINLLMKELKVNKDSNNNRVESNVVDLNIGGEEFCVSKATLTKKWKKSVSNVTEFYPTNMFEDLMCGRVQVELDKLGRIFIDRNPKLFEIVLDYLRTEKIPSDLSEAKLELLLKEAEFYRLNSLADVIKAKRAEKKVDVVEINVGGTVFSTLRSTLVKKITYPFEPNLVYASHLIEKMINGEATCVKDRNGAIFIDRDPKFFAHMLNYLRVANSPKEERDYFVDLFNSFTSIMNEATYFGIGAISDLYGLHYSTILDTKLINSFHDLTGFRYVEKWRLLYRATRDGFSSQKFLEKCSNKSRTLLIVKSTDSYIFGGYSNLPWDQKEGTREDKQKFAYVLVSRNNQQPYRMTKNSKSKNMVLKNEIVFGDDEIRIKENSNSNSESKCQVKNEANQYPYYYGYQDSFYFKTLEIELFQKGI